ncbi:hypothetical protein T03_11646 [Trichinella britovi]|uniref:Uncharacterized protein n=1 Tax=Trichinella britovi TaxID=45882 RepID=A0A0V1DD89_TRIBR|nr:hypothetical protein T03_11646 [Trichinella britovi]
MNGQSQQCLSDVVSFFLSLETKPLDTWHSIVKQAYMIDSFQPNRTLGTKFLRIGLQRKSIVHKDQRPWALIWTHPISLLDIILLVENLFATF